MGRVHAVKETHRSPRFNKLNTDGADGAELEELRGAAAASAPALADGHPDPGDRKQNAPQNHDQAGDRSRRAPTHTEEQRGQQRQDHAANVNLPRLGRNPVREHLVEERHNYLQAPKNGAGVSSTM
jgi:hypothetical protein